LVVARSRYAEDQLAASVARGATQYLILGPGLDTSAYRGIALTILNVFEVDHLNTQSWKKDFLAAANITVPTSVKLFPWILSARMWPPNYKPPAFALIRLRWFPG
jgi:O-methyltransferase involved in polyketide biosynthesis